MFSWAGFIAAGVGSWVIKGAAALGFGLVTYVGWSIIKGQLDAAVADAVGSMSAALYSIMALAGVMDAIGIWLGALSVVVTLLSFRRLAVLNG